MITWIQLILQKHHKVVFSILLFFIIVAFVFTIGSSIPFFGDRNPSFDSDKGKNNFYGWDLNDQNVANALYTGAYFDVMLSGADPRNQEHVTSVMYARAILLSLAKNMNVPAVNDTEYKEYVHSRPYFMNKDGSFSLDKFNIFIKNTQLPEAYINSILVENALVNKMMEIVSGPGYVMSADIDAQYKLMNSKWSFYLASLNFDDYNPPVKAEESALKSFFESNKVRYEVPPQISLQVAFFAIDETEKYEPSESELTKFYDANKSRYMEEKDGKQVAKPFILVRESVIKDLKTSHYVRKAMIKAQDFSDKVYEAETTYNSDKFKSLLAESKVSLKKVPPYRQNDTELTKDFPISILKAGLSLDAKTWIAPDVVPDEKGAYVVFLESKAPAYIPEFAAVKASVEKDYKDSERYRMFMEKADTLDKALKAAVANKKSFEAVAKEAKASVKKIDNLSLINTTKEDLEQLASAYYVVMQDLPTLKVGDVSSPKMQGTYSYIIYVTKIDSPAVNKDTKEYKAIAENMKRNAAYQSLGSFIGEMQNSALKQAPKSSQE